MIDIIHSANIMMIDPQQAPPPKRLSTKQMLWPARHQHAHRQCAPAQHALAGK